MNNHLIPMISIATVVTVAVAALPLVASADFPAAGGPATQGWLGIVLDDPDSADGVAIDTVLRRSPAHNADIDNDDRILSVNGRAVRTPGKLESILGRQSVGQTVSLVLEQEDEPRNVDVQLLPSPSTSEVLQLHHHGFEAPELTLEDLDGTSVDLRPDEDADTLRVVEFWATWCSVCRQVSRKFEEAVDETDGGFDVLSVTSEDESTVREHLETNPKAHDIALDEDERAHDAFLVNSYPFIAVIAPDGTIESVATDVDDIEEIIDELVAADGDDESAEAPAQ